jgi:nucleotide-binding universal stress UspA family protein
MTRILVGVDGSPAAERALRWAAAEADLRGAELEVVMCWEMPVLLPTVTVGSVIGQVTDNLVTVADGVLKRSRDTVSEVGQVEVHTTVLEGHPARVLLDLAEKAELLVVGSTGHGELAGVLMGSVALHCVTHSPCPVVVVPDAPPRRAS